MRYWAKRSQTRKCSGLSLMQTESSSGPQKCSHRAIDDVLALYEVTKAMSEERDDLTDYIDLLGYNPKYGITGQKLRQITYMPQSYKLGCRLPDLMNGGGSCE